MGKRKDKDESFRRAYGRVDGRRGSSVIPEQNQSLGSQHTMHYLEQVCLNRRDASIERVVFPFRPNSKNQYCWGVFHKKQAAAYGGWQDLAIIMNLLRTNPKVLFNETKPHAVLDD